MTFFPSTFMTSCFHLSLSPTQHFTISEPQNWVIVSSELHKMCQVMGFKALTCREMFGQGSTKQVRGQIMTTDAAWNLGWKFAIRKSRGIWGKTKKNDESPPFSERGEKDPKSWLRRDYSCYFSLHSTLILPPASLPADPFTILEPSDQGIGELYVCV